MTDSKRQAHNNVVQMVLKAESVESAVAAIAENSGLKVNVV